eukprot:TRINITY_DN47959_c0_g1_i1.p1 TRINITY_DN47959_c0_g1~~TRINITY_DN47959_c0_g1_i1.p1  ORF type:complete len:512 (+),score=125.71 TRINITY_DN47959_c0_g1_i1:90-1625(+)
MFLSKDFLSDGGGGTGGPSDQLPRPPPPPPPPGGGGPTSLPARPGSAAGGRPASAAGSRGGYGEDEQQEEQGTPSSAAALRQKMLQQRQRALQKQRTGGLGGGSMVMANQGMPSSEGAARTPTASTGRPGTSSSSAFGASSGDPLEALKSPASSPSNAGGGGPEESNALLQSVYNSMAQENEAAESLVAPNPMSAEEIKAEEERRRKTLAAALDEKGLSPVFDPGPASGSGGAAGGPPPKSTFDISTVPPDGMKPFLLNPSPKTAGMIECRIIREKGGLSKLFPKYILETDSGVFLMAAKKQKNNKTSKYVITMSKTDDTGKDADAYLGKLRSNFLGLEFVAYGEGMNPKKIDSSMSQVHALQLARQELLAVQYSSSLWGTKPRGPRKMGAVIPKVQPTGERLVCRTLHPDNDGLLALQKANNTGLIHSFHNKPPKWNEQVGAFVLNFNKRVTQASVKNFQLTTADDPDTVFLQFGRVGKDVFNMDFRYPFSPFQAFAICLSSFDYKLCCE